MNIPTPPSLGRDAVRAATLVAASLVASVCLGFASASAEGQLETAVENATPMSDPAADRSRGRTVATARVRDENALSRSVRSQMAADLREAFARSQRDLALAARAAARPASPAE